MEALARWIDNSSAVAARPCAVDTHRQRVVFFGDAYHPKDGGLAFDIRTRMLTRIQFQGEMVPEMLHDKYDGASYDPELDRFFVKTSGNGTVLSIAADTFVVTEQRTVGGSAVPDALNGVQTRWQRMPLLGGYAYYPRAGSGIWFLTTR
jgi:hypothetical protein